MKDRALLVTSQSEAPTIQGRNMKIRQSPEEPKVKISFRSLTS